jgi:phosphatidylglycerophosphate synthase
MARQQTQQQLPPSSSHHGSEHSHNFRYYNYYYRKQSSTSSLDVVLFVPNVLGYLRIFLALLSLVTASHHPIATVLLWIGSSSLDLFDGMLARALHQTSTLGVYVDIAADNVLRTAVWMAAAAAASASAASRDVSSATSSLRLIIPALIISLEWCTMICTQLHALRRDDHNVTHWKDQQQSSSSSSQQQQHDNVDVNPWWIQQLFRNNFRNPLGIWAIYGLFGANVCWYASHHDVLVQAVPYFRIWQYVAYSGRGVAMSCELYLTTKFLKRLYQEQQQQ